MDVEKFIDDHAANVADAVVHLMQSARDNPGEPLDDVRGQIVRQAKEAFRPLVDQTKALESAMDQAADAVLDVAANMLAQFPTLTGSDAARMLRELKSTETDK